MKLRHLVWLWAAILCSCTAHHSNISNTIPAVGGNLEKTAAHVQSADRLVTAAEKDTGKTGKVLLSTAHAELSDATKGTNDAKTDLTKVQSERDKLEVQAQSLTDDLTKAKSTWGYRLQVFVDRLLFWIKTILITTILLHFGLNIASLFVAGPAGPVLLKAGAVVNPFAWFQFIISHIHFNRQLQAQQVTK